MMRTTAVLAMQSLRRLRAVIVGIGLILAAFQFLLTQVAVFLQRSQAFGMLSGEPDKVVRTTSLRELSRELRELGAALIAHVGALTLAVAGVLPKPIILAMPITSYHSTKRDASGCSSASAGTGRRMRPPTMTTL